MSSHAVLPVKFVVNGEEVVLLIDYDVALQLRDGALTNAELQEMMKEAA
ncbi:hypothetical protein HYN36_18160 [Vibrio parahaemolyticus]|nr:hypothetical protein [Vibrio parahaemolyticus]MBM5311760.1 hypothetical protein [Vibrio parahaemolyticus]MBM5336327.1 hypothetical protein [Vibrio parahaemolyticus]MCF9894182.1 hypothetical protein [Vibrio parahaemolyticus]MCF9915213.1 hypothetical protein [Vibrio parahaemolyticus]